MMAETRVNLMVGCLVPMLVALLVDNLAER
jgi:hypothetical protein